MVHKLAINSKSIPNFLFRQSKFIIQLRKKLKSGKNWWFYNTLWNRIYNTFKNMKLFILSFSFTWYKFQTLILLFYLKYRFDLLWCFERWFNFLLRKILTSQNSFFFKNCQTNGSSRSHPLRLVWIGWSTQVKSYFQDHFA